MSHRQFTREQKLQALQRLAANGGNVARTAREIGVSPQTIYVWKQSLKNDESEDSNLSNSSHFPSNSVRDDSTLQRLYGLEDTVLTLCEEFSTTITPAIQDAPLNQRVTSFIQLIDRAMKMATELPPRDTEDADEDIARSIFPPDLLEILDTRPDHTPSESDPDPAK